MATTLRIGRRQDRAGIAAGPERRVHIDAAVARRQELQDRMDKHGNVTSQSASDGGVSAAAARHHSRAPSAATRELNCCLSARTFAVASASSARKRSGSQNLKLVTKTGEGDRIADAGMGLQGFGEHHPALAVDLQHLAGAVERGAELLAFLRIGRKQPDQRLDVRQQRIAAGIERRPVERPIAVEALEAVAGEHRAEGGRDRDPPLRVQTQRVLGHEAVHGAPCSPAPVCPVSGLRPPARMRTRPFRHAQCHAR